MNLLPQQKPFGGADHLGQSQVHLPQHLPVIEVLPLIHPVPVIDRLTGQDELGAALEDLDPEPGLVGEGLALNRHPANQEVVRDRWGRRIGDFSPRTLRIGRPLHPVLWREIQAGDRPVKVVAAGSWPALEMRKNRDAAEEEHGLTAGEPEPIVLAHERAITLLDIDRLLDLSNPVIKLLQQLLA